MAHYLNLAMLNFLIASSSARVQSGYYRLLEQVNGRLKIELALNKKCCYRVEVNETAPLLSTSESLCRGWAEHDGDTSPGYIMQCVFGGGAFGGGGSGVLDVLRQILAVHLNSFTIARGSFSDEFQSWIEDPINRMQCGFEYQGCIVPTYHLGECALAWSC